MRCLYDFELEPEVRDWLDSLSDRDFQAGRRGYAACSPRKGTELGGPWSDHLEGAVWECGSVRRKLSLINGQGHRPRPAQHAHGRESGNAPRGKLLFPPSERNVENMSTSWADDARRSPVPRRRNQKPRSAPGDWEAVLRQSEEQRACERLAMAFLRKLDVLTRQQQAAIASCAYLEEQDLRERLAPLQEHIRRQHSQLIRDYEKDLRTAARSLPEDELSTLLGQFRDASEAWIADLDGKFHILPGIIQQRYTIEHAHAERAGILGTGNLSDTATRVAGHGIALGMIQGMAVMSSGMVNSETAAGFFETMAIFVRALAAAERVERYDSAVTVPVLLAADGRFCFDLTASMLDLKAIGDGYADCAVLDYGLDPEGRASRPLVYMVDMPGSHRHPDDGSEQSKDEPTNRAYSCFGRNKDGTRPAVGLLITGPATLVTHGRRILDADILTSFARSIIFRHVYDGTPQAAAAAMRAAQALEVIALVDPAINGGLWADVNPSRQVAVATLLIDGWGDGRLRFLLP